MRKPTWASRSALSGMTGVLVAGLLVLVTVCATATGSSAAPPPSSSSPTSCGRSAEWVPAASLVDGPHAVPSAVASAAARAGLTSADFEKTARSDDSLFVDPCGQAEYRDTFGAPSVGVGAVGASASAPPPPSPPARHPLADTFDLESDPGSAHTLYLDFNGGTVTGTAWNSTLGDPYQTEPYDFDGSPSTFSDAERTEIQFAWQVAAEDYAPFDVNVTTKEPTAAQLQRSSDTDPVWGITVMVTQRNPLDNNGTIGGVAQLNAVNDDAAGFNSRSTAWAFADHLGPFSGRPIGETVSHEAGHVFGLLHDGDPARPYYPGAPPWNPIMGISSFYPVSQWSKGEYDGANNTQDDVALIAAGLGHRLDDHSATVAGATALDFSDSATPVPGVIEQAADVDAFTFTATSDFDVNVDTASALPDLDLKVTVVDESTGQTYSVIDPYAYADVRSQDGMRGLDADVSLDLPAGGPHQYLLLVQGTGTGDPQNPNKYTGYGSLGAYTVKVHPGPGATTPVTPPPALTMSTQPDLSYPVGQEVNDPGPVAAGGTGPYAWGATGLPPAMQLINSYNGGYDSGDSFFLNTPRRPGSYIVHLYVTDANGTTVTQSARITITNADGSVEPLGLSGVDFGGLAVGQQVSYSAPFDVATGGTSPYAWSASDLPPGLAINPVTGFVSGAVARAGTGTARITVTDADGATRSTLAYWEATGGPAPAQLAITGPATLKGETGAPLEVRYHATGGAGFFTWSATGPPGVAIDAATGALSGVPSRPGTFRFVVKVVSRSGSTSQTATRKVVATVAPRLSFRTAAHLTSARVHQPYADRIQLGPGVGPFRWSVASGLVPPGLKLALPKAATSLASVSMTGTPKTRGTWRFAIRVTDADHVAAVRTFEVRVR